MVASINLVTKNHCRKFGILTDRVQQDYRPNAAIRDLGSYRRTEKLLEFWKRKTTRTKKLKWIFLYFLNDDNCIKTL